MAGSTTNIDQLATSDRSKESRINANFDAASPGMIFGRQASGCSALTWAYYGGAFRTAEGAMVTKANGTLTLAASNTNYVEVDGNGNVTSNTTAFTSGRTRLYTVTTNTTSVTAYTDHRNGTQGAFKNRRHVVTITYAANVTIDWSLGYDVVKITADGSLTLAFTNGGDGQVMILEITQGAGGSKTINLPGTVRYSADIPSFTPSTAAYKTDKLGFMRSSYEASPLSYDLMAVVKGF